jgi:hypothetical protein
MDAVPSAACHSAPASLEPIEVEATAVSPRSESDEAAESVFEATYEVDASSAIADAAEADAIQFTEGSDLRHLPARVVKITPDSHPKLHAARRRLNRDIGNRPLYMCSHALHTEDGLCRAGSRAPCAPHPRSACPEKHIERVHGDKRSARDKTPSSDSDEEEYVLDQCTECGIPPLPDGVPLPKPIGRAGEVIGWRCPFSSRRDSLCAAGGGIAFHAQLYDPNRPEAALRAVTDHLRKHHIPTAPTASKRARLSEGGPSATGGRGGGSEAGGGDEVEAALATLQRVARDHAKLAAEKAKLISENAALNQQKAVLAASVFQLQARADEADIKIERAEALTVESETKVARALEREAQAEARASAAEARLAHIRIVSAVDDAPRPA